MIIRQISNIIRNDANKIPVIGIVGPRQSGKTTLAKGLFPNYKYFNLENLRNRELARKDPESFIKECRDGAIIDEIQNVPELFSYIQVEVDRSGENGKFI